MESPLTPREIEEFFEELKLKALSGLANMPEGLYDPETLADNPHLPLQEATRHAIHF